MVFAPTAWDVTAAMAVEPDADGWTLDGVDHASVTGGVLTIGGAATDKNDYYRALGAHAALGCVWAQFALKIETGCTTASLEIASATMNAKVTVAVTADAVVTFTGAAPVTLAQNMIAAAITFRVLLTAGGWRAWTVDSTGVATYVASGTPTTEDTNNRVTFGKNSATDDSDDQYWGAVKFGVGVAWAMSWPPNKWLAHEYDTTKNVNEAWDGTIETVHGYDARSLSFTTQAHDAAEIATLAGYYTATLAPGTEFYLAEDQTAINAAWHRCKLIEKSFKPAQDSAIPTHYQLGWKLRRIG